MSGVNPVTISIFAASLPARERFPTSATEQTGVGRIRAAKKTAARRESTGFRILHAPSAIARVAVVELTLPPGKRPAVWDQTWRGFCKFPEPFRRKMVSDLVRVLETETSAQTSMNDSSMAPTICFLLGNTGTNGQSAIPALEKAVRANVFGAKLALDQVSGRSDEK